MTTALSVSANKLASGDNGDGGAPQRKIPFPISAPHDPKTKKQKTRGDSSPHEEDGQKDTDVGTPSPKIERVPCMGIS